MLRARRSRRETYPGTWLPEPIVTGRRATRSARRSCQTPSGLVVLDTLSPSERLAFVQHDVFGVSFDEIATLVGKSPAATRQLASRAQRRVRAGAPNPDADVAVQRRAVDAFLAATRAGDFEALLRLLDPDVVLRIDDGGLGRIARPPMIGSERVGRWIIAGGRRFAGYARPILVNGTAGVVRAPRQPTAVVAFTVVGGRIATIELIADPRKTGGVDAQP